MIDVNVLDWLRNHGVIVFLTLAAPSLGVGLFWPDPDAWAGHFAHHNHDSPKMRCD